MNEQRITADLLRKLMSEISEEYWCAGWLGGLEHVLWDVVTGKRTDICTPEEIEQLKYLSEKCGGWIVWDKEGICERFVSMEEWLRLYEARHHSPTTPGAT